jgi:hypothetical protein
MSSFKMPLRSLPQANREQAIARWSSGKRAAGTGDWYLYHWVREDPPADYCGPLPFGRLVRRAKEA